MVEHAHRQGIKVRLAPATTALTGWDDAPCSSKRVSKELTSVDISRAVVATAARPETMCLMRGDIPLLMTVLL